MVEASRPKIIAAIPAYNEESTIGKLVLKVKEHVDQVIIINDGSHDNTIEAAKAAGAIVINHVKNKGYGEAIKSCFEVARAKSADILVTLDGDGQHNPDEIPKLIAPLLNQEADLVIGSRLLRPRQQVSMPRYRAFGISVITFLFNLGSRTKVSDSQSGFRAYSKKVLESFLLSEKGMSISIETLEKARKVGAIIKEVPIICLYPSSPFNLKAIKHGLCVALSVLRLRLKNSLLTRTGKGERAQNISHHTGSK